MKISLIAALDRNRVIGANNRLPWKLPADMRWFVRNTRGKAIIMGRKTFESFGAKPLKDRLNIVITRDLNYRDAGITLAHSVDQALAAAQAHDEVMVIGGADIYQQLLPKADRLYLTLVDGEFVGDSFFPAIDFSLWQEVFSEQHVSDADNSHAFTFKIFDRR